VITLSHRIVLTERCNLSCAHCFNAEVREDRTMDADILIRFMRENSHNLGTCILKIMGGEPTIHPRMAEVTKEGLMHYGSVGVFTNGTNMEDVVTDPLITKNHFQGRLSYTINGFTFKIDDFYKYQDYIAFLSLHFVIPIDNHEATVRKIEKCMELPTNLTLVLSTNTQLDLFDETIVEKYRKVWTDAITKIVPQARARGIQFRYDHRFPICFYTQEMIETFHKFGVDWIFKDTITCCGEGQLGLIAYNFDIYYCNQTRIKLGSLLDENGNPKSVDELHEMIQQAPTLKVEQIKKVSDKCRTCNSLPVCKVGCYYNTLKRKWDG